MPDDNLKKMLTQAKSKPRNFMLVVNGSEMALFLSPKSISTTMAKEMKERLGGGKTYQGVCKQDGEDLAFKSTDALPSVDSKLRSHIKAETGLSVSVKCERVDSLDVVDEPGADFSKVEGGKSKIDVHDRQEKEMNAQVAKMREFVRDSAAKKADFERIFQETAQKRKETDAKLRTAEKVLKEAKAETPPDATKVGAIDKDVKALKELSKNLSDEWMKARGNVDEVQKLTQQYVQALDQFDKATTFDAKFDLMQHGRQEAIDSVREKMDKVYEDTGRKLAILGRTADTFQGDKSWATSHPKEGGRVLQEDQWSMAVNDAFIKAGIDQKAEFAMITRFKDEVLQKIKSLLMNPEGRSKDQLKKELREFVRQKADPALFTGGKYNEGFAVSMIELEQLIDDDYVMMEHDPDAGSIKKASDLGKQKPVQVMVPSGKGQKIKGELEGRVKERDERRDRLAAELSELIKASKKELEANPKALKLVSGIKQALDDARFDEAERALQGLRKSLEQPQ